MSSPPDDPVDIGYIKCDPCCDGDHDECIGLKQPEPFCGCRCPWTEVIDDVE